MFWLLLFEYLYTYKLFKFSTKILLWFWIICQFTKRFKIIIFINLIPFSIKFYLLYSYIFLLFLCFYFFSWKRMKSAALSTWGLENPCSAVELHPQSGRVISRPLPSHLRGVFLCYVHNDYQRRIIESNNQAFTWHRFQDDLRTIRAILHIMLSWGTL